MPFDLDRSTHALVRSAEGGTQTVVSKDRVADQVALIREHLRKEAAAFAIGDYAGPATIHGIDMPGLKALSSGAGRVSVRWEDVDHGGRIRFAARGTALVKAIHQWFEAQRTDHGHHASH